VTIAKRPSCGRDGVDIRLFPIYGKTNIFTRGAGLVGQNRRRLSAKDPERPDEDYFEVVECFYETMRA
jgi:hypothetical protein